MMGGSAVKNQRSFVPALAGALLVLGVATRPAVAQLKGNVKSVDTTANRLVVTETGTGAEHTIAVPVQATIVTPSGRALMFKDLRQGDGLAVTHVGGVASRILAEQARLVGTVKSADPEAKRLVIRETVPRGDTGTAKDVILTIDDRTTIENPEGKAVKFGDIKAGDGVSIVHAGDLAQRIETTVKPDELTGFVKSVGANLKTVVVTQTGTNTEYTIAIDPETVIETTEGKTLNIKELKEGDGVGISHVSAVAKRIRVAVKPQR